jgi:hypothetical protein
MAITVIAKSVGVTKTRGQIFDAYVEGDKIVSRSTTPFLDACRVMLKEGCPSSIPVIMRHMGSDHDALRSTVGHAAKLSVKDSSIGRPIFGKWQPYAVPISPPMSLNEVEATQVASEV